MMQYLFSPAGKRYTHEVRGSSAALRNGLPPFFQSRLPLRFFATRRCIANLRVVSRMGSRRGFSGHPTGAEANGALCFALHSGCSTRVACNPGIVVKMPRDAAATNFAVCVDLETETRLRRIGLIRPAATHAACVRPRPSCGRAFTCAHIGILIKNVLYRLAGWRLSCVGSPFSCCSHRLSMPKP